MEFVIIHSHNKGKCYIKTRKRPFNYLQVNGILSRDLLKQSGYFNSGEEARDAVAAFNASSAVPNTGVGIGDEVMHSLTTGLVAKVISENGPDSWDVVYLEGSPKGGSGNWLRKYTQHYNPCKEIPTPSGIDDWVARASDHYLNGNVATKQEETDMNFINVQKKLMVDGVDLLTMGENSLFNFIQTTQKRVDELGEIDLESSRINDEIDKLNGLIRKAIKLTDKMS